MSGESSVAREIDFALDRHALHADGLRRHGRAAPAASAAPPLGGAAAGRLAGGPLAATGCQRDRDDDYESNMHLLLFPYTPDTPTQQSVVDSR